MSAVSAASRPSSSASSSACSFLSRSSSAGSSRSSRSDDRSESFWPRARCLRSNWARMACRKQADSQLRQRTTEMASHLDNQIEYVSKAPHTCGLASEARNLGAQLLEHAVIVRCIVACNSEDLWRQMSIYRHFGRGEQQARTNLLLEPICAYALSELLCKILAGVSLRQPEAQRCQCAGDIREQGGHAYLTKSRMTWRISPSSCQCAVTPRKDMTFGEVQPSQQR